MPTARNEKEKKIKNKRQLPSVHEKISFSISSGRRFKGDRDV